VSGKCDSQPVLVVVGDSSCVHCKFKCINEPPNKKSKITKNMAPIYLGQHLDKLERHLLHTPRTGFRVTHNVQRVGGMAESLCVYVFRHLFNGSLTHSINQSSHGRTRRTCEGN